MEVRVRHHQTVFTSAVLTGHTGKGDRYLRCPGKPGLGMRIKADHLKMTFIYLFIYKKSKTMLCSFLYFGFKYCFFRRCIIIDKATQQQISAYNIKVVYTFIIPHVSINLTDQYL